MSHPTPPADANPASDCPPEWLCSVYVDRELEPAQTTLLEAHLERCGDCRARVAALEEETTVLRVALDADASFVESAPGAAAAPGLLAGGATVVGAAFAALTVVGALLEARLPGALAWLAPFDLDEPFALFFDLLALASSGGPWIGQVIVPLSALLIVGMLLSASVARPGRSSGSRTAVLMVGWGALLFALWAPEPVAAFELRFGEETVTLAADEVVDQSWVVRARTLRIEGTLRGDLVAIAERVIVSGVVEGNLAAAARKVEVSGRVGGTLLAAGERVRVSGEVAGNVYAACDELELTAAGGVGRDLFGMGEGIGVSGRVARDVLALAEWFDLRGQVGGDVDLRVERAEILSGAAIAGDLRATYADEEAGVQIDPGAVVDGETALDYEPPDDSDDWERYSSPDYYGFRAVSLAAAFAFGMALFAIAPWLFLAGIHTAGDLFRRLAFGLVALLVTPAVLVLLAVTVVGIPLAIAGLLAFAIAVYAAIVVASALLGLRVMRRGPELDWRGFALPLLVGLVIVFVAMALPFLGGVIRFVAFLLGLGVVCERVQARLRG